MKRSYYKKETEYVATHKDILYDEYSDDPDSFTKKYGISRNYSYLVFGRKKKKEYPQLTKSIVAEMRKTMSDRRICKELDVPVWIFYNHIEPRGEPRGIRTKKIVEQKPIFHFERIEHKPYWDITTEVPTIGPIKGIKYSH